MKIKFEKIDKYATTPTKAYKKDACWDLYASHSKVIEPFSTEAILTGLIFEIPPDSKLHIYSRSGLALKNTICVFNAPGVIDETYRGELKVILYNGSSKSYLVERGAKIAQFSREIVLNDELEEGIVDTITDRGSNGFGSSGL